MYVCVCVFNLVFIRIIYKYQTHIYTSIQLDRYIECVCVCKKNPKKIKEFNVCVCVRVCVSNQPSKTHTHTHTLHL